MIVEIIKNMVRIYLIIGIGFEFCGRFFDIRVISIVRVSR